MSKEYLVAAIVVCTSFAATAEEPAPTIRAFEIDDVERLGREIYDQDQLAWVASDVASAQGRDPVADQIRG